MTAASTPSAEDRRIDVYRRGRQFLCVARSAAVGSLGMLFEGEIDDKDREQLGRQALEWIAEARKIEPPGSGFQYPEDLLPQGWDVIRWHAFMSEASLCAVEPISTEQLVLRPFKNLHPVGEEFSHEGGHALDSPTEAKALAAALRAALDVAGSISKIKRAERLAYVGDPQLSSEVTDRLVALNARLFERPARTEVIEISEGFFLLPPPLRQLIFDVVWRRGMFVKDGLGRQWEVRWLPLTADPSFRAYPLFSLFRSEDTELLIRLDSKLPSDPEVYRLNASRKDDLAAVLGEPQNPGTGPALSKVLATLERG